MDRATVAKHADMDDMTPKPPMDRRRGSKIDPYAALVDEWLEADRMLPRKQRHTAKRVHDRLRAETGYDGEYTTTPRYVRRWREANRSGSDGYGELVWAPGVAQIDFGVAKARIAGELVDDHCLVVTFPHSNMRCVTSLPGENAECLCRGLVEVFERIEIYGDSVSCGERNEAVRYTGMADPETDLSSYSNSWFSYGAITARNLGAQLHAVAQGGAALLDGIGWFDGPDYTGMESIWDRIEYNPALGETKPWDFTRYTPHVVIIALGQNDAHPDDFMATDYNGEQARHWRTRYADFIRALRDRYPSAHIVCTTTALQHDAAWDRAIDEVCRTFGDPKVTHFLYSRNGSATPGHPRIAEHEEMARELTAYLEGFGDALWN